MAITRLWQSGAEADAENSHNLELSTIYGAFTTYSSHKKTGDYSYQYRYNTDGGIVLIDATKQLRIGQHYRHYDSAGTKVAILVWYGTNHADPIGAVSINGSTIEIITGGYEAGSVQAISGSVLSNNTWHQIGVDLKIDASGWVSVYVDGDLVVSWAGNTGSADINYVQLGPYSSLDASDFTDYAYTDDIYIDDSDGEGSYAALDDLRFPFITPDDDGEYSGCTGQDGNSTYNYQNVDEQPHDGDITFNRANALDEKDTYTMTTVTISGYTMEALIPVAVAKKLSGSVATEIALMHRESSTDVEGTYQIPGTGYTLFSERVTTPPVGASWTQTYLDNVEVGFVAKGSF